MNRKTIVCAALTLSLAVLPALAAVENDETARIDTPAPTETFQFSFSDRSLYPERIYGVIRSLESGDILLETRDEAAGVILHLSENTLILDAVTGDARTYEDLKEGESLYAWTSPAMTLSLPPQTSAQVILCNIPQDYVVPTYTEIQRVDRGENGSVSALTTDQVVLHLSAETELFAYRTKNIVGLDDIRPGTKVLAWYSMVMESYPAQAVPSKVMVFPYDYAGWITLNGVDDISLNGQKLELPAPPYLEGEELMLPLRAVAEALGCEVQWSAQDPDKITVLSGGQLLYVLTIGKAEAVMGSGEVAELSVPVTAKDGVSSLSARDLLRLHDLKAEGRWPV